MRRIPKIARLFQALALGFAATLLSGGFAHCETTVSFYSHGWGVGPNAIMYFPHAFVVIEHTSGSDAPPTREAYGYTAASVWDPTVLIRPSRGVVEQPDPVYAKRAVLQFTVVVTDDQYSALREVVAAWGGPASPLYDLRKHNCVGFAAEIAKSAGLRIPSSFGADPAKFLEEVRLLNPDRLIELAANHSAPSKDDP